MATKKKGSTKKKNTEEKRVGDAQAKRQALSVVFFGISLFVLAVVLIPGENVWKSVHEFFFGVFGWTAFALPIILIAVSFLYAAQRLEGKPLARVIECSLLALFAGAATDIFIPNSDTAVTFGEHITAAYQSGISLKSGGFTGALLGEPIVRAFGSVGAIITIIILLLVLVLLTTGTSIIALVKSIQKPIKHIEQTVESSFAEKKEKEKVAASDIDLPIGKVGSKVKRDRPSSEEMQKRVIDTYMGNEPSEDVRSEEPPVTDDADTTPSVDEALAAAKREAAKTKQIIEETKAEVEVAATEDIQMVREGYKFPPIDLLIKDEFSNLGSIEAEMEHTAERLVEVLRSFGVETRVVDISRGPTVTRYELQPSAGVKISKITSLSDDIALNLAAAGVRIEAPIPGKAAVGIEIPNRTGKVVRVRDLLESPVFSNSKSKLTVALGKDIAGNAIVTDIAKMPHGLIAGSTGSGKSVCINSLIMSILYKASPDEVKLIMVDPKVVELAVYNGIPHLLVPVVTDPRKAAGTLGWAVSEMENRYRMFAASNVRDIDGYNRVAESNEEMIKLARIVIIIDELADLMMTAPKEVEDSINRIAAKARAAGMHLIIATQRPSVDVVTGVIKANIPTRVAFMVSSQVDSRTILDSAGAEKLLGKGDMLFNPAGAVKPSRIQGCFVTDGEVEAVVDYVKADHSAEYDEEIISEIERQSVLGKKDRSDNSDEEGDEADSMLPAAIECVIEMGQASTSMLQRKLKLGYARAARLMDEMEARGVIGGYEGAKPRAVLITREQWMEMKAGEE